MNQFVPDWAFENDSGCLTDILPMASQRKPMGLDDELVELLWRDGHVVMHSQTHRRSPGSAGDGEIKQSNKADQAQKYEQSLGNSIQEAEAASWFQYPLDDPFEKDFCSEFFPEIDTAVSEKLEEDRCLRFGSSNDGSAFAVSASRPHESAMPPPKSHFMGCVLQSSGLDSVAASSKVATAAATAAESSMMTVASSNCGSNQIQAQTDPSNNFSSDAGGAAVGLIEGTGMTFLSDWTQSRARPSSSGGSGCSYGRTAGKQSATKRKAGDAEDSARCQSEEAEYESIEEKKPAEGSSSKRRSRAAEVHNLSERRRRDRINEKMKALQDLIPHCNKTDKASMLDEAIEYLKSLQLQLQMMWMGSGMASMMFPVMQQYVSGVGMGMSHASTPRIHGGVQLPTVPFAPQSAASASPAASTVNFPSQIQNAHLPESYARYLSMQLMQPHQVWNENLMQRPSLDDDMQSPKRSI